MSGAPAHCRGIRRKRPQSLKGGIDLAVNGDAGIDHCRRACLKGQQRETLRRAVAIYALCYVNGRHRKAGSDEGPHEFAPASRVTAGMAKEAGIALQPEFETLVARIAETSLEISILDGDDTTGQDHVP